MGLYRFCLSMFPSTKMPGSCGGFSSRRYCLQSATDSTTFATVGTMERKRKAERDKRDPVFKDVIVKHCESEERTETIRVTGEELKSRRLWILVLRNKLALVSADLNQRRESSVGCWCQPTNKNNNNPSLHATASIWFPDYELKEGTTSRTGPSEEHVNIQVVQRAAVCVVSAASVFTAVQGCERHSLRDWWINKRYWWMS